MSAIELLVHEFVLLRAAAVGGRSAVATCRDRNKVDEFVYT